MPENRLGKRVASSVGRTNQSEEKSVRNQKLYLPLGSIHSRINRSLGDNKRRVTNAALHGFEELPWRTLCAQKQIVGNTGSRVAKETLYGLEEIPWRTLCARKQLVGNSGRGCRPPAPRAKSMKFLGHPNYAPGLCAALCAVLEIASWLSLADLDVPWIEEANRWGAYGRS